MNEELILEVMKELNLPRGRAEELVEWYFVKEMEKVRTISALRNINKATDEGNTRLWNKLRNYKH